MSTRSMVDCSGYVETIRKSSPRDFATVAGESLGRSTSRFNAEWRSIRHEKWEQLHFLRQFTTVPAMRRRETPDVRVRFAALAGEWRKQSAHISSLTDMAMLEPYQSIIGMGETALPLILEEMQRQRDHWFWALRAITGENPVPSEHRGSVPLMTEHWLAWGRRRGYI